MTRYDASIRIADAALVVAEIVVMTAACSMPGLAALWLLSRWM